MFIFSLEKYINRTNHDGDFLPISTVRTQSVLRGSEAGGVFELGCTGKAPGQRKDLRGSWSGVEESVLLAGVHAA